MLVPFPFTDLSGQKVRPALVLYASRKGENCIVAFITSSTGGKKLYPFDIPVSASRRNGLKVDSMIKIDHFATLQKKVVLGELGMVELSVMIEANRKLKILFRF